MPLVGQGARVFQCLKPYAIALAAMVCLEAAADETYVAICDVQAYEGPKPSYQVVSNETISARQSNKFPQSLFFLHAGVWHNVPKSKFRHAKTWMRELEINKAKLIAARKAVDREIANLFTPDYGSSGYVTQDTFDSDDGDTDIYAYNSGRLQKKNRGTYNRLIERRRLIQSHLDSIKENMTLLSLALQDGAPAYAP